MLDDGGIAQSKIHYEGTYKDESFRLQYIHRTALDHGHTANSSTTAQRHSKSSPRQTILCRL